MVHIQFSLWLQASTNSVKGEATMALEAIVDLGTGTALCAEPTHQQRAAFVPVHLKTCSR